MLGTNVWMTSPREVARNGVALRRVLAAACGIAAALLLASAYAHHSYAMYDGSIYRVFTGVMVRVVPNAAHFEMHFVPLSEDRTALVRLDSTTEEIMERLAKVLEHDQSGRGRRIAAEGGYRIGYRSSGKRRNHR